MSVRNNELGGLSKKIADKTSRNAVLQKNLEHAGGLSLGNAFVRAYFKRTAKAFEKWKESRRAGSHQDNVIKRTI